MYTASQKRPLINDKNSRSSGLSLQILQSRTTSTDLGSVLSLGNNNTNNDGLLQDLDLLLQLGLDLVDKLGITTETDLVRSSISTFPWESNETSLLE